MKRTYQPSNLRRKRTHGFLERMSTKSGRNVLKRRRMKGRKRLTVWLKGPFRFTKKERITHPQDFRRVMKMGRRISSKNFILFIRENENGLHRLGIVVKKEVGPANLRNRIKRYFREFFRLHKHQIKGSFDLIILAKKGCVFNRYSEASEELRRVFLKWKWDRCIGISMEQYSSCSIFIRVHFQSFLDPAVVLLLLVPPMHYHQFNVSESWMEPSLPWRDSSNAILLIQVDTTQFLKIQRFILQWI